MLNDFVQKQQVVTSCPNERRYKEHLSFKPFWKLINRKQIFNRTKQTKQNKQIY